jgi:hypothetical protein
MALHRALAVVLNFVPRVMRVRPRPSLTLVQLHTDIAEPQTFEPRDDTLVPHGRRGHMHGSMLDHIRGSVVS